MLSSVLRSDGAVQVNIEVVRKRPLADEVVRA
jgi:hypothetical protein